VPKEGGLKNEQRRRISKICLSMFPLTRRMWLDLRWSRDFFVLIVLILTYGWSVRKKTTMKRGM
jgi:hypothetical protein